MSWQRPRHVTSPLPTGRFRLRRTGDKGLAAACSPTDPRLAAQRWFPAEPRPGDLSPRRRAVWASCLVFCLGFGALNVFTLLGSGQPHLPGLYAFRAATIGDGFLLPLLAYSLVRSAGLRRRGGTCQKVLSRAGAIVGVSAGTVIQAYALADPDPRLDWTFPAPHSYNLPGWYHTAFLIVASGFFGRALGQALARIREEAQRDTALALRRIRSIGSLGILSPGLAFLGLLGEDDLSATPGFTLIVLAAMIGLSVIACAALRLASGPRSLRWCALAVLGSLLPATALCAIFLPGHGTSTAAIMAAGAVGLAVVAATLILISPGSSRRHVPAATRGCIVICQALCAAGPVYAMSTGGPASAVRLAAGCSAGLLLAGCELGILQSVLLRQVPPRLA